MSKIKNTSKKLKESLAKDFLSKNIEMKATRDGYGKGLVEAGKKNEKVVVLCADLTESTRTLQFKEKFPNRFIECGVAEQNMMGIAAGMALAGKIPFVTSYAVFNPGRNWGQLRLAVCYSQANVKIIGTHSGLSAGPDGATHQGLEDLAITRVLPNLTVVAPCDYWQAVKATMASIELHGPIYLRFSREKSAVFTTLQTSFEIGKAQIFREGKDLTIIACGPLVYEALWVAEQLSRQENFECEVINCATIKPLDRLTILTSAKKTGKVMSIEEHQVNGGLGSAIAEVLSENLPIPLARIGMPDQFGESGSSKELARKYGLDRQGIVKKIRDKFL